MRELSALCTEVLGRTGMETCELIRAAAGAVRPAAVVAVDALAARSPRRLCRTVQLSDTGLIPGSGVGSHRTAVDRETVGVPVIAVGVPTVIDGAALGSGTEAAPQGLYVTPRDIDRQVRQLGRLLGYGISLALQPGADGGGAGGAGGIGGVAMGRRLWHNGKKRKGDAYGNHKALL